MSGSRGQKLLLRILSALSTVEYNYLLNPTHPQFSTIIAMAKSVAFRFDKRLKQFLSSWLYPGPGAQP
jgi:RES domain-containing protein